MSDRETQPSATETRRFKGDYGVAFRMRFERMEDAEAFAAHLACLFPELGSIAIDRQIARVKLKPADKAALCAAAATRLQTPQPAPLEGSGETGRAFPPVARPVDNQEKAA